MRATKLSQFAAGSVGPVKFEANVLTVALSSGVVVSFNDPIGFRILDEGDLLEFWPACASPHGSGLFEIHDGGWLHQESMRKGFLSATVWPALREFLVTGADDCASVLSVNDPVVQSSAV